MPINRLVVKEEVATYANALFENANAQGGVEEVLDVYSQAEKIVGIVIGDMDLSHALNSSDYSPEQRHNLAKAVFADANPVLSEVLAVMAERKNMDLLYRVFHEFVQDVSDKLNLCIVEVTTVVPLDDQLRKLITDKAEADLGKQVVLRESIDKSILGGIIMSTNGKRIDASVLTQLNHARNVLKEQ